VGVAAQEKLALEVLVKTPKVSPEQYWLLPHICPTKLLCPPVALNVKFPHWFERLPQVTLGQVAAVGGVGAMRLG